MKTRALPNTLLVTLARGLVGGLLLLGLALFVPPAGAQEGALTVDIANFTVDESGVPQVVMTVADEGGPIDGLDAAAFRVELDGRETPVTAVTRAVDSELGVSVVLALDISASMQGAPLDQAKAAARTFLEGLAPNDSVAIVLFADGVNVVQQFTTDKVAARALIDRLGPSPVGGTKLFDATGVSVNLAAQGAAGQRAVVLLSDGDDTASGLPSDQVLAALEPMGVPVFAIGLGPEIDIAFLREVAEESGGLFAETPTPEGLAALYQKVSELLRGQYLLTLDTTNFTPSESGAASLRVRVSAGGRTGVAQRAVCFEPTCIVLSGVSPGQPLEERATVNAQVISVEPVEAVEFSVDGRLIDKIEAAPYQITLDPATLENGDHRVEARAIVGGAAAVTATLSVQKGAPGGGFLNTTTLLLGFVVLVVLAAVLFWFLRFRRPKRSPEPVRLPWKIDPNAGITSEPEPRRAELDGEAPAPPRRRRAEPAGATLTIVSGPHKGSTFSITDKPAGIGSGLNCAIRLNDVEDGREIAPEEARVWLRDDKLMVHELRRLTVTGSTGGRWMILGPGERFSIGPCTFEFHLAAEAGAATARAEQAEAQPAREEHRAREQATAPTSEPQYEPLPKTGRIWPRDPEAELPSSGARDLSGAQASALDDVPRFEPLRRTGKIWPIMSGEAADGSPAYEQANAEPPPSDTWPEARAPEPPFIPAEGPFSASEDAERAGPADPSFSTPPTPDEGQPLPSEGIEASAEGPPSSDGAPKRPDRWAGLPDIFKSRDPGDGSL